MLTGGDYRYGLPWWTRKWISSRCLEPNTLNKNWGCATLIRSPRVRIGPRIWGPKTIWEHVAYVSGNTSTSHISWENSKPIRRAPTSVFEDFGLPWRCRQLSCSHEQEEISLQDPFDWARTRGHIFSRCTPDPVYQWCHLLVLLEPPFRAYCFPVLRADRYLQRINLWPIWVAWKPFEWSLFL